MMQAARRAVQAGSNKWLMQNSRCAGSTKIQPELTAVRYKVERGPYAVISDAHAAFFDKLLGHDRVITEPDECDSYNIDWLRIVKGSSRVVLKPRSSSEVSAILSYCNEQRLAVCPQSGNTGLVGGSVPVFDEVVLSMRLMNQIIDVDELAGALVCESGCVLQTLEEHVNRAGLMMPIDLGAKGSCLIGGNVSTNAGGLRLLRYGNLHGSVLGLEAVTADGKVIDCLNTLKKDNTGYHLKHLFIGSEGTLGVVTKVAIQCPTLPNAVNVAFLGLKDYENVLKTLRLAKRELGEVLSSFELMDRMCVDNSYEMLGLRSPLSGPHEFYVLVETSGSSQAHDEEKLNGFLEKLMEKGFVEDGTVTSEPSKVKSIWELRERLAESQTKEGYLFKYDISVPLANFYDIIPVLKERLKDCNIRFITGFGHLGDGNLHLQVNTPDFDEEVHDKLEPFVFEYTSRLRGSISAEHGIGFKKAKYLSYSKDDSAIQMMRLMKRTMDPNGILNPYKVLY